MNDQQIEDACEALRRALKADPEVQFGRIEGLIRKGRVKDLAVLREIAGMRDGKIVAPADGDQEDGR